MNSRQLQAQETKARIREAAIQLFQNQDLDRTTIAEICKAANVSVGNFYHYFKTKEAVIIEDFLEFDQYIVDTLEKKVYSSPLDAVEELFLYGIRSGIQRGVRITAQILQIQLRQDSGFEETMVGSTRPYFSYLAKLLTDAKDAGLLLESVAVDTAAHRIWRLSRGLLFDWATRGGTFEIETVAEADLQAYLRSIRVP